MTNQLNPLSLHNVSVGYDGHILLEKLTLTLYAGQLTCCMGPNGVGKSTLLRTLAGLQPALSGNFLPPDSQTIAVVLTDKINPGGMRVHELVSFGRYPYTGWHVGLTEYDHQVIDQALQEVHISHLADNLLDELSDGQRQLVLIARALAQETPVILLDEPTAHLDLNNRVEIMKLLRRLAHQKSKAILVTTHELDLALQLADRIWLATPVKLVKDGIPEDLVLDNSFDDTFQLKGFDLKTGKIQHEIHHSAVFHVEGEGHLLLWTKNALEREGFPVESSGERIEIQNTPALRWAIRGKTFTSLQTLLEFLRAIG